MAPGLGHLISIPENPAPPGGEATVIAAADAVPLRIACWRRAGGSAGTVLILPGRSEFIEKYFETIGELLARGFCVTALDWRGQGGSARQLRNPRKGHVDHFSLYRRDLDAALRYMQMMGCPEPWVGLAHSMGGAVLIDAAAHGELRLERAVLSAPMVGIYKVSRRSPDALAIRLLNLAGFGGAFLPGGRSHTPSAFDPFEGNALTSDRARFDRAASVLIAGPDLAIGAPTIAWAGAAFRLIRAMRDPAYGLKCRCAMLFITAGKDTIVSSPAAEELASRVRGATALSIPGARHEILMERDVYRTQFWAAFDSFAPTAARSDLMQSA